MAVADAVCRLVPGVLSDPSCYENESHWNGMLEAPQYSRPEVWHDRRCPQSCCPGTTPTWRSGGGSRASCLDLPPPARSLWEAGPVLQAGPEAAEGAGGGDRGEADLTGAFTFGVSCGIVVVIWFLKLHLEMDDMSFKIVVDSCCDLTPQMKKEPCFSAGPHDHPGGREQCSWMMRPLTSGPAVGHAAE